MRRELIESYYEEYQRELERFLESDPEMFSLEAEIHHYMIFNLSNVSMCSATSRRASRPP